MNKENIQSLQNYLVQFPKLLKALPVYQIEYKPYENKWSKKEILGHLIDSAINNLMRFVVAQHENDPNILYDQVKWCKSNHHQTADVNHLITLWESLNRQLLYVWSQLTPDMLSRTANGHTLEFLIDDYVSHFEQHLNQIKNGN